MWKNHCILRTIQCIKTRLAPLQGPVDSSDTSIVGLMLSWEYPQWKTTKFHCPIIEGVTHSTFWQHCSAPKSCYFAFLRSILAMRAWRPREHAIDATSSSGSAWCCNSHSAPGEIGIWGGTSVVDQAGMSWVSPQMGWCVGPWWFLVLELVPYGL